MAKLKFKDENNNFIPVVQDVKVNNVSVFDGKDASIELKTVNGQSLIGAGNIAIDSLPSQTGHSGEFLTTNGTDASWATATKVTIREWS